MKIFSVTTLLLVCAINVGWAQMLHPVHWSYAAKKIGQDDAVLFIKATIDQGWHIYSTSQKDGGPVKTSFVFNMSREYELESSILEPAPMVKFEKSFEMNICYFESSVIFQQRIKLKAAQAVVNGNLKFMVCNDHQCLPPEEVSFSIPVK